MALTQISTQGIKDGTITGTDLATNVDLVDNQKLRLGTGNDLEIYHDGSNSYLINTTGELNIRDESRIKLRTDQFVLNNHANDENIIYAAANGAVELYHNGSKKFETTSYGAAITSSGSDHGLKVFHSNGNEVASLTHGGSGDEGALILKDSNTATVVIRGEVGQPVDITTGGTFNLEHDSAKLRLGAGNDLQIYHDGSNSYIEDAGTGALLIKSNTLYLTGTNAANDLASFVEGGAVSLFHNDSKKFETGHGGEYGSFQALNGNNGWDGMAVGNSKFVFMGSNSDEAVGIWNDQDNGWMVKCVRNAETQLQYNGSKKFETTSVGAKVTGRLGVEIAPSTAVEVQLDAFVATGNDDASDWGADGIFQLTHQGTQATNNEVLLLGAVSGAVGQIASGFGFGRENTSNWGTYISFKTHSTSTSNIDELIERWKITSAGHFENNSDSIRIKLGASDDLQIYHSGHSVVQNTNSGAALLISSFETHIVNAALTENIAKFIENGACELYHANSKKFETTSSGATMSGSLLINNSNGVNVFSSISMTETSSYGFITSFSGKGIFLVPTSNGVYLDAGDTSFSSGSDERSKTDLTPISDALSKINNCRSVIGRYKTDDISVKRSFLIAQDFQSNFPEAVSVDKNTTEEGNLGLRYQDVIPLLLAGIKELSTKIDVLETEVATLKAS